MRLGIDFGTTRVVAAAVDRGNYPVVSFEDTNGEHHDWYPPLIAVRGGQRLYGWEAWAAQADPNATIIRSIKRSLEEAGPFTTVQLGQQRVRMQLLLAELVDTFRRAMVEKSSLPAGDRSRLEVMLGVPANANSNQRFLTVEAFQSNGFEVIGLLNEPSAASIEYGHGRGPGQPERVLVYDLGGGTFDVSLVEIEDRHHSVIASEGVPVLGGDDFDALLADMALDAAAVPSDAREHMSQAEWFRLHEECREKKEALHPNTRKVAVDLSLVREEWAPVSVPTADFYEHCRPLVDRTLHAMQHLVEAHNGEAQVEAVYVTGGGSELPVVSRLLKEVYGRRVKRSAYTRSATAIGLAIRADHQAGYEIREQFNRHFGVWREAEGGRSIVFDPLFPKGTALPLAGEPPLVIRRGYHPAHNVGHFRYLECSHRAADGHPIGDIAVWDQVMFPFDPGLRDHPDLSAVPVFWAPAPSGEWIEEEYSCDAAGSVSVSIANRTSGYQRCYRLGKWEAKEAAIVPGKRRRGGAASAAGRR